MSGPDASWARAEAAARELEALLAEPRAALERPELVEAIANAATQLRELLVSHQVITLLSQHDGQWPFEDLLAATGAKPDVLRRVLDSLADDVIVTPPSN